MKNYLKIQNNIINIKDMEVIKHKQKMEMED